MTVGVPVRILVLPIFRRHWCFHAIEDAGAAQKLALEASNIEWRKGANLEERLSLLGTKLSSIVSTWFWVFLCIIALLQVKARDLTSKKAIPSSSIDVLQARGKIVAQWKSLESAADGTIKNRIFRSGNLPAAHCNDSTFLDSLVIASGARSCSLDTSLLQDCTGCTFQRGRTGVLFESSATISVRCGDHISSKVLYRSAE